MTVTVEKNLQELKSRLEIEQLAWNISKLAPSDVERLADALYRFDSECAMQLMRDVSIVDMETQYKSQ